MTLLCAVCLHTRPVRPRTADTVANGNAVCLAHLPYAVARAQLSDAVHAAKESEA